MDLTCGRMTPMMDVRDIDQRIHEVERQIAQLNIDLCALRRARVQATQEQSRQLDGGKTLLQG